MKGTKKREPLAPGADMGLSTQQLLGKQSVRATFRLPEAIIKLLKTAADYLGIKQKSLIDQLVENRLVLISIAEETKGCPVTKEVRRPKTFVLSRNALDLLDEVSTQHDVSRDVLIESSINRLLPFVTSEQEKQRKRTLLSKDLTDYVDQGKRLLEKADKLLEKDDRLRRRLAALITHTEKSCNEMRALTENRKTQRSSSPRKSGQMT